MDRFKFRVWDNHAKAYIPVTDYVITPDGLLEFREGKHRGEWSKDRYVKEQCTGLRSFNGHAYCYENDIVCGIVEDEQEFTGAIKYENGCYLIVSKDLDDGYICISELPDIEGGIAWIEILGSVRANPELLKVLP